MKHILFSLFFIASHTLISSQEHNVPTTQKELIHYIQIIALDRTATKDSIEDGLTLLYQQNPALFENFSLGVNALDISIPEVAQSLYDETRALTEKITVVNINDIIRVVFIAFWEKMTDDQVIRMKIVISTLDNLVKSSLTFEQLIILGKYLHIECTADQLNPTVIGQKEALLKLLNTTLL